MGCSSLEARLRTRLALVLAPTLTAIAVVAVLVTAHALDSADDERARTIALSVRRSIGTELAEGDAPADAEREAIAPLDPAEVRVWFERPGAAGPPLAIGEGGCASLALDGAPFRACAVSDRGTRLTVAIRTDAHRAALGTLARWMIGVVAIALLGSFAAARVALRAPLRALARLVEWAERAAKGDAPSPLRDDTEEIDRLARAFDALVGQLMDALTRERANSAHIAHELRTPLTAIVGELAAMPADGPVARLREDAARLSRVIDAILLLSEPPRARRSDTVVNVADLVRKLAPAGAAIDAPDEALVEAEPHLVELALHNLLENAAKYAPGGATAVHVAREDGLVRVGVVDGGPGLAAEARGRIFDRYWREASDGDGRGLGLALVRAVAERHGGGADARPGPGEAGLDVGFTMGPILAWHEGTAPPR